MTKLCITGDKGFIGSHLSKCFPGYIGMDLKKESNILWDDLPEADTVIHLAAQTSVLKSIDDPTDDAFTNVIGTVRLAEYYKGKRFIFASSGGAIQEEIKSPYGLSKFCAEEYIKLLCKDAVILRFPNIYGPGSNSVVDKFIQGSIKIFGDGTATRDYVHVDDLVKAIIMSQYWKPGTYYLGSGKNTSVLDIAKATGKPYEHLDRIEGELQDSFVKNSAPGWEAETNVLEYVKGQVNAS